MQNRELQVINSVLKNKDVPVLMTEGPKDLFKSYKDIWDYVKDYYGKHKSIPDISVVQEARPDLEFVEIKGEAAHYMEQLKNDYVKSRLRFLAAKTDALVDDGVSPLEILQKLQSNLSKLNTLSSVSRDINVMDFDLAEQHYESVRERALAMGGVPGISTGIPFIDSGYPSGFAPGDLIVTLGWTGRGKSLLSTLIACNAWKQGHKPMIVSLEMSPEKVRNRIFTILGSGLFSNSGLALGDVDIDNFRTFKKQYTDKGEFTVIGGPNGSVTPNFVQSKIDQHKPTFVIFDYAQLGMDNEASNDMVARMRNMSSQFKGLAMHNQIPVNLISSATADSVSDCRTPPMIEQVAWSRQLAFDADLAMAVHKHDASNFIEVVSRKNRDYPMFSGYIDWDIDNGVMQYKFELEDD